MKVCLTQDDAHIFMTEEQAQSEIQGVMKLIDEIGICKTA